MVLVCAPDFKLNYLEFFSATGSSHPGVKECASSGFVEVNHN